MRYMTKTRPETTMDQIFDSMFYNASGASRVYSSFPVDILEENDQYIVKAELAGFNDGDVDITLNDNLLVISAEKLKQADEQETSTPSTPSTPSTSSGTDKSGTDKSGTDKSGTDKSGTDKEILTRSGSGKKYLLRERVERLYKRTFSLPKDSDREAIKASLEDGMLHLTIGKKPEAKPVTIKIN